MARLKYILIIVLSGLALCKASGKNSYKPALGDKFNYKISRSGGKSYPATFVYDKINNTSSFYYKWGSENPKWGTWTAPEISNSTLLKELKDTNYLKRCNVLYLNSEIFKQVKSGKIFKLFIEYEEIEFGACKLNEYLLPIIGAGLKSKILTATSSDQKWIINILDNENFPLITSLLGNVSWQLQSIVPFPMYPITQSIIGESIDSKKAELFKAYIKESCVIVEASYNDNYKKLIFNEYFCPIVGIRFSLKNDTIVSLHLVSKGNRSDGYEWQTYRGYIWGIYGLGDKQKVIEKKFGKPDSTFDGRNTYTKNRLSLRYNSRGELETVDYE